MATEQTVPDPLEFDLDQAAINAATVIRRVAMRANRRPETRAVMLRVAAQLLASPGTAEEGVVQWRARYRGTAISYPVSLGERWGERYVMESRTVFPARVTEWQPADPGEPT